MSGYVIIFNHKNFTNEEEHLGTEHDVLALKNLFEKFQIYHRVYTDYSFLEIANVVDKLKEFDFKEYSYLAVFILTHGDVDNNLCAKDQKYNFNLNLVDPIVDNNRTLDDKPKIFIVQACKGKSYHCYDASTSNSKLTTPRKTNICFVYSTYEGYVSRRNSQWGGPFIQSLCKHIDEYGTRDTIEVIMRSVTKDLIQNKYQVPMIISTLTDAFFFCAPVHEPVARSIDFKQFRIRGYAIIFNHKNFTTEDKQRLGTEHDVLTLKHVFENFNISYEIYNDFTLCEIESVVKRLKRLNFKDYSYLSVIILTHSKKNNILYAKDQKYNLFDLIINPIVDNNESLAEKPKIFFVQACKGNSHNFYGSNIDAAGSSSLIAVPSQNNTFIAFSTYEGFISEQSTIIGGPFIQSLCKHINEYGSTDSIEAIMRRVTNELIENIQQVPKIFSTLSEEFYFGEKNLFNVIKANQQLPREPTVDVDENHDHNEIIKQLKSRIDERKKFLAEKQLKIQKENEEPIQHSTISIDSQEYKNNQLLSIQYPNYIPINNNATKIISQLENGITNLKRLVYEIQKNQDPQLKNDFMQQMQEINLFLLKHQNDIDSLKNQAQQSQLTPPPIENVNHLNEQLSEYKQQDFKQLRIRGYAIIFNHKNFTTEDKQRLGTEHDVLALKHVFENFNISYAIHNDFTFLEIATEVERLKKHDFKDNSYLAVFILTHGNNNNILCAKNQPYNLFDLIINPIVDYNNSLVDKHRIFIVQACKGQNSHQLYHKNGDATGSSPIIAVPSKKNTFIAFSTYEGFSSVRNPITGGHFIQSLCKNIIEYGSTDSIEAIMRRVTNELTVKIQQVPTTCSTLSDEFFFGEKNVFNVRKGLETTSKISCGMVQWYNNFIFNGMVWYLVFKIAVLVIWYGMWYK